MEAAPEYWQSPDTLRTVYVTSTAATGTAAAGNYEPACAVERFLAFTRPTSTPLAVNHQGLSAASTISFNLPLGVSLSQATQAINNGFARLGAPITVRGTFQGTAKAFQDALSNQPLLILSALLAVYLVLGILYESLVQPADHPGPRSPPRAWGRCWRYSPPARTSPSSRSSA